MADRFPLILNTSASQIQEIASGDQLDLTGNNIANAGIVTATAFHGDGSNLTNAGVSLAASTNNTVVTVTGADALAGESNLTFDSSTNKLAVTAADSYVNIGSNSTRLQLRSSSGGSYIYSYTGGTFHIALAGSSNLIQFDSISQTIAQFKKGAECSLYHSNTKRFETTSTGAKVTGDLSVTGVLTYEDVTNVDSVGIITARDDIKVGSGVTITPAGAGFYAGIVTATNFVKIDGSSIGGLDASVGSYNVIGGSSAGAQLTSSANRDTLIGTEAGTVLTSGEKNTFVGAFAGKFQSTSNRNTAFGASALVQNSGDANTAVGFEALSGESERLSMIQNTAVGQGALRKLDEADYNTAIGAMSLYNCVTGNSNVAIGYNSLYTVDSGYDNVAIGCSSGLNVTTGSHSNVIVGTRAADAMQGNSSLNVFIGKDAFGSCTGGNQNVAIGYQALGTGSPSISGNVALGGSAGASVTDNYNTFVGHQAGDSLVHGGNNIIIGYNADASSTSADNEITLGNSSITRFRVPGLTFDIQPTAATLNGLDLSGLLREGVKVTAGKLHDNTNIDLGDGMVHYFTTQETNVATPNLRFSSSATLNNSMDTGESISVTIITTAAAAGYSAQLSIDGSNQSINWVGGSAPSAGGSSGVDIYTYNIIKTASATFTVIANLTKTS